jgi:hypothetical protein
MTESLDTACTFRLKKCATFRGLDLLPHSVAAAKVESTLWIGGGGGARMKVHLALALEDVQE